MYRRVFVPLDGSPLASAVLPHVSELVRCTKAEVILFRATAESGGFYSTWPSTVGQAVEVNSHDPEIAHYDQASLNAVMINVWSSGTVEPSARIAHQVEAAQRYLEEVAAGLAKQGARVRTIVGPDHVAATILDAADHEDVDLIAMSTHGRSGLGRFLLGSVADAVVHHAKAPVLLVRSSSQTEPHYRRILAPLDGSEVAHAALPHVREIAACTGAEVVLLQVVPQPRLPVYDSSVTRSWSGVSAGELIDDGEVTEKSSFDRERRDVAYLEEVAEVHLDQVAAGLEHAGIRVTPVVQVGAPAETILDFVKAEHIDLITMSTHGRSGLARFMMGSVADRVVRHAEAPVMLVRAATTPAQM
jgi:nucleotide-binding universal stress UspA family protein